VPARWKLKDSKFSNLVDFFDDKIKDKDDKKEDKKEDNDKKEEKKEDDKKEEKKEEKKDENIINGLKILKNVIAIYDYSSEEKGEITLTEGDKVSVLKMEGDW
jgi:hypothetical protein